MKTNFRLSLNLVDIAFWEIATNCVPTQTKGVGNHKRLIFARFSVILVSESAKRFILCFKLSYENKIDYFIVQICQIVSVDLFKA